MNLSDLVERAVRGIVTSPEDFRDVVVGLHNACVHGDIINATGATITDEQLCKLFDGLETITAVAKDILESYY